MQFGTKLSRFPFLEKSLDDLIVTRITLINIVFGTLIFGKQREDMLRYQVMTCTTNSPEGMTLWPDDIQPFEHHLPEEEIPVVTRHFSGSNVPSFQALFLPNQRF